MTHPLPGVGVFGTGFTAKAFIHLLKLAGFRIEALWGRTTDDAEKLASEMDIPFFTSNIDDVLLNQHVDLVCIHSPPFLHSQIAVKTLGIGKNVVCERPGGLGFEDTLRMLNAAKYYPSLMSLMTYNLRFLPTFQKMRQQILEGYIGDILIIEVRVHSGVMLDQHYNWLHDGRMGGGMLAQFGGHFIDVINFISGQKAKQVHGFLTTFQKHTAKVNGFREITSDDFCTFQMKLDKGACCTCILNNNVPGKFSYEVLVIGTKACLIAKDGILHGQSKSEGRGFGKQEVFESDDQKLPSGLDTIFPIEISEQIPVALCQGMMKFIESLKESFMQQDDKRTWDSASLQSAATFEDALYVQSVLESVRQSSETSDWVQVHPTGVNINTSINQTNT
uniref:Glucose-fructose oxidoreductase domain-containing protein 1 n=1 Tax=Phallusia mammillata TaxID=59560 RepID=A0A6F9DE29_9ASCI|nr:glucose-fructose oxidoreductase domain-containing protein 1 [Phallusia mammillata]